MHVICNLWEVFCLHFQQPLLDNPDFIAIHSFKCSSLQGFTLPTCFTENKPHYSFSWYINYRGFFEYFSCLMTSSISVAVTAVVFLYGFNWTVAMSCKVLNLKHLIVTDFIFEKMIYRIWKYTHRSTKVCGSLLRKIFFFLLFNSCIVFMETVWIYYTLKCSLCFYSCV